MSFGRITVGSRADLLLLERNPLDDIRATREITSVITHGRLLGTATLETMMAEIRDRNVRTAEFVDRATADVASAAAYADSSRSATGEPGFELGPAVLLGIFTFERGARGDAIALLELAARNYPSSYFPEYLLGQMRLLSNDREGAQRSFSRVLELVPGYPAARRRLVAARSNLEPDRPSPPGGRR